MRKVKISLLLFVILTGIASCVKIDVEPDDTQIPSTTPKNQIATFDRDIKPIFLTKCAPCHLENGDRVNKWNNYTTVKTYITGIMGRVTREVTDPLLMPKNGPKLSNAEINLLKKWIDDGLLEK
jgi:hypothetical protein